MRSAIRSGLLFGFAAATAACTSILGDFAIGGDGGASGTSTQGTGGASSTATTSSVGGASTSSVGGGGSGPSTTTSSAGGDGGAGSGCDVGSADCDSDPGCETDATTLNNCGGCNIQCIDGGTCESGECSGVARLARQQGRGNLLTIFRDEIYWTVGVDDEGLVLKLPIRGGNVTQIASGQPAPYGIAVNSAGIFWANRNFPKLMRASLDGTGMPIAISSPAIPLVVRADDRQVFWSQREGSLDVGGTQSRIGRIEVAAMMANPSYVIAQGSPHGVALDDDFVYWADYVERKVKRIGRSDGMPQDVATSTGNPFCVVVDENRAYWTNGDGVLAAPKGGGGTASWIGSGSATKDIAADDTYVYWTDQSDNSVVRARKDGVGDQVVLADNAGSPLGIAIDSTYVYWVTETDTSDLRRVRKVSP